MNCGATRSLQRMTHLMPVAAVLPLFVASQVEASHHGPSVPALAVAVKHQAGQICQEVHAHFLHTGAGRLVARKASEISEVVEYFVHVPCARCDERHSRLYLKELDDLVDDMEDLADDLKRGGSTNRARYLREMVECLEDTIKDLDKAAKRCSCSDHRRDYDRSWHDRDGHHRSHNSPINGHGPERTPPLFPPPPGAVHPPRPQSSIHVPLSRNGNVQFWLSLALD